MTRRFPSTLAAAVSLLAFVTLWLPTLSMPASSLTSGVTVAARSSLA